MPSLAAFEDDGVYTRRVTRTVETDAFEAFRRRVEDGLAWGVGALVEDSADRLLLVYEDETWKLPGGGVEPDENRRAALVREVREETGVGVTPDELLAVTEVTLTDGGRETQFHFGTYRAAPGDTTLAADPGLDGEAIERVEWRGSVPENCLDYDLLQRFR
ncbi:NUDIX hydrolase [Halomicroarcula sp. F13]|uniref:NUDIX hydrolase n=1 Tax=Haloarcula rubra TaxID=2487747 RepID=A0AAW4PS28_9EURY|nr:NUDIX hydrolase [Halomicroarcula rubra]MBX0323484.1 NUDIX hydrolase [Halomicroarcula rubra]